MAKGEGSIFLYFYDPSSKKYEEQGRKVSMRYWSDVVNRKTSIEKKMQRLRNFTHAPERWELRKISVHSNIHKDLSSLHLEFFPDIDIIDVKLWNYDMYGIPSQIDPLDNKTTNLKLKKLRLKGSLNSTDGLPDKLPSLTLLEIKSTGSEISQHIPYMPKLKFLTIENSDILQKYIYEINPEMFTNLEEFVCKSCKLSDERALLFRLANPKKISVTDSDITNAYALPISNPNLNTLDISHNHIETDFEGKPPIIAKNINLSNNKISKINNVTFPNVTQLDLAQNQIESITNLSAPNLEHLNLEQNKITRFDPQPLPKTSRIDLKNNKITDIEINPKKFPELTILDLNKNKIESVANISSDKLIKLGIAFNPIKSFEGIDTPNLEHLEIGGQTFRNFKGLPTNPNLRILTNYGSPINVHSVAGLSYEQFQHSNFYDLQFFSKQLNAIYQQCDRTFGRCQKEFPHLSRDIVDELKQLENRDAPQKKHQNSLAFITQNATTDDVPFIRQTIGAIETFLPSLNASEKEHYGAITQILHNLTNYPLYGDKK